MKKIGEFYLFVIVAGCVITALTLATSPSALEWETEIVESHPRISGYLPSNDSWEPEHAIAVASTGTVFLAYGRNHLYVAHKHPAAAQWQIEIVDEGLNVGRYTSLELDADGHPHVSYFDEQNGALKYAYLDGDGWHRETVDSAAQTVNGINTSLALDSLGRPHISYYFYTSTQRGIKHAYYDGNQWQIEVLDSDGYLFSSIEVDGQNHVHIAYYAATSPTQKVVYAVNEGNGWVFSTVEENTSLLTGYNISLAITPAGVPYVSFYTLSGNYYRLHVCRYDGTEWQYLKYYQYGSWRNYVNGFNESWAGRAASMVSDSNGTIHLVYKGNHVYYDADAQEWVREVYDTGNSPDQLSLCLDGEGCAHVAYYAGDNTVRHAYKAESGWLMGVVDTLAYAGGYNAVVIDSKQRPCVAYRAERYRQNDVVYELKYGCWDGSDWTFEIIDSDDHTGYKTIMHLDSQDRPHVACATGYAGPKTIKYFHFNGTAWTSEAVAEKYVNYLDMAIDSNDHPHIVYFNYYPDQEIIYAHYDGSAWQSETVSRTYAGGNWVRLVLDSSDHPHLSYYGNDGDLIYMHNDGSGWQSTLVDWNGTVGLYISLTLDSRNYPHIAYYHAGNHSTKYAYFDGNAWHTEFVEWGGQGIEPSLTLDAGDNPHLVFYDNENADLKYAFFDDQWVVEVIESAGATGSMPALAMDANQRLHVVYQGQGDARYALSAPLAPKWEGDFEPPDGDVDGSDLAVFVVNFGLTDCAGESSCTGDFDHDGDVDESDLAIFAADFGRTDCPFH